MSSIHDNNLKETEVSTITVSLAHNEYLRIEKDEKKVQRRPNYFMVGNGSTNMSKIFSIDLLKELVESSKAGQFLLIAIKDGICYDNGYSPVVTILKSALTSTQQQYLVKGYKELRSRGLVIRVGNSKYMINPNALIPTNYEEAIAIWNKAVTKDEGTSSQEQAE